MPHRIDVAKAQELLSTRDDLRALGCTERDIEGLVRSGAYRRVRHGRYVSSADWEGLWAEGRHLVEVVAVHLNSAPPGPVFCGPSAAVLHGLPLYRLTPASVHVVISGARHGRTRAGVVWHDVDVPPSDIVEIRGFRCTSSDRTVLDLARAQRAEVSLSAADAALREEAVDGHAHDVDAADAWTARLLRRAERVHGRGIRQARQIVAFADGRAQLPGESVSRLMLARLGFAKPDLQTHVVGAGGESYWLDFGFVRSRCFGEFDGAAKYLDGDLRGVLSIEETVLAEKRREDDIRGVTGWRFARWGSTDITSLDGFSARLRSFGVRPPG